MVYANILVLKSSPLQHEPFFPLSFYTFYEWVLEGALHYEHRTRSFLFQKSKENPVFHHMCPLSHVYLAVIDFYDSYGDSCIHFVVIWFRHRKDELERRMSALQESRRELMVQLEGLMRLLRVRNLLDNNLALYFPRHVWKWHLFAHFLSLFFLHLSLSHRCLSNMSAFTHCHLSSFGWQDEEQKQAVSVPLIQLCNSGVNMQGHSCKSLNWHMYCVWQNRHFQKSDR